MSFSLSSDDLACRPLTALDFVSFDIETTGLDPKRARTIEIAAVRFHHNRVFEEDSFQSLVDPGVSIPPSSTKIHGLTDADVAGSAEFKQVVREFAEWAGPSVFVGYGSDFDVAVLRAEHERFGILWSPLRTVDVLPLVQIAELGLSNFGLETVAKKLDIAITGRHRALSDAIMTAEVFASLIPRLKQAGVTTLAEAERAAAKSPNPPSGLRQDPISRPPVPTGMDSFPFRRRVRAVMTSPAAEIGRNETISVAIDKMAKDRISSLIVRWPETSSLGIITSGDVIAAIAKDGSAVLSKSIGDYCSRELQTVTDREFLYRAIVEMKTRNVRHLGVVDENENLVGAITGRDLFHKQGKDAIALGSEIQLAGSASELARVWSDLSTVAKVLASQAVAPRRISAIISRELRAMTKRACELAEIEIGTPPTRYAMLVLGSAGRGESLLAMDQDNAIVFADGADETAVNWFAEFGNRVSEILDEAGVRFCDGGIMGSNHEWRKDVSGWTDTVLKWLSHTRQEGILNADIFFDAMTVHGDSLMAAAMYRAALKSAQDARPFLRLLAQRASEFDSPTGFMGRWRLDDKGRIDLKRCGIMPIFSAARAVALEHGINHRSTYRRLSEFKEMHPEFAQTCDDLSLAHGTMLGVILNQQLRDFDNGIPLSSRIIPGDLDPLETQQLKWSLGRVPQVTALLGVPSS
ncbi:MAG: DUF294 nucleotidyltransferase-like domain-containing protein [Rhodobacteraceae bacterium]|nr:DUF294 nucleotidyltransferase-like domain-containing protein [Paracoccaceae bacterium]